MAIDTRDKRSSAILTGSPWRSMWPNADGSLANKADRQHMAFHYRGIEAGGEETGLPEITFIAFPRPEVFITAPRPEVFVR